MRFYVRYIIESEEKVSEHFQWLRIIKEEQDYRLDFHEGEEIVSSFTVAEEDIDPGVVYNLRLAGKNGVYFGKENTRYQIFERYAGVFYQQVGCEVKFYKNAPQEECVALTNFSVRFEKSAEAKTWDKGFSALLASLYPSYERTKKIRRIRKDLLSDLSANDSLAYLEAQLDFVTLTLLNVLDSNPELKERIARMFEDYLAFETVLKEQSIFAIKPEEDCLKEIREGKSFARKQQEAYYDAKYS